MQKKGDPGVLKVREDTLSQAETTVPIYTKPWSETRPPHPASRKGHGFWALAQLIPPCSPGTPRSCKAGGGGGGALTEINVEAEQVAEQGCGEQAQKDE